MSRMTEGLLLLSLDTLIDRLLTVRRSSLSLITPLEPEDLCLQGMADASPPKWHLGHTTWFFEQFLLRPLQQAGIPLEPAMAPKTWGFLFNSYYDTVGARHPRPERGLLSRPTITAVLDWRQRVDQGLASLKTAPQLQGTSLQNSLPALLELGLQHEQQHQELLLMDLLDGFSRNPLEPIYCTTPAGPEQQWQNRVNNSLDRRSTARWLHWPGGLVAVGHQEGGDDIQSGVNSFHFDNEAPCHQVWLAPFSLADRMVTNAEYAQFIADGGYQRPQLWMSEGWGHCQQRNWQAPRYWRGNAEFTLAGLQPRRAEAPVRHLSWFEADAYARWAGARLPREAEWEVAAGTQAPAGGLPQAHGLLWQWTESPYRPYPGFRPAPGAVGEYNGKFMTSQFVLRGSSFLTPNGHSRLTYRNFFPPASRWMAAGLRLAHDGHGPGTC